MDAQADRGRYSSYNDGGSDGGVIFISLGLCHLYLGVIGELWNSSLSTDYASCQ